MKLLYFFEAISGWVTLALIFFTAMTIASFLYYVSHLTNNKAKYIFIIFLIISISSVAFILTGKKQYTSVVEDMLKKDDAVVYVNGDKHNRQIFKKNFLNRKRTKVSGSSPEKTLDVLIASGKENIRLTLRQDSRDKKLYWIFPGSLKFSGEMGFMYLEQKSDQGDQAK